MPLTTRALVRLTPGASPSSTATRTSKLVPLGSTIGGCATVNVWPLSPLAVPTSSSSICSALIARTVTELLPGSIVASLTVEKITSEVAAALRATLARVPRGIAIFVVAGSASEKVSVVIEALGG